MRLASKQRGRLTRNVEKPKMREAERSNHES